MDIGPELVAVFERLLELAAQAEEVEDGEVSLTFVDDDTIRRLNKEYRGVDKATDVLSFPMEDEDMWFVGEDDRELAGDAEDEAAEEPVETDPETAEGGAVDIDAAADGAAEPIPHLLGDIVISVPTARRQSEAYGHSLERELGFLFVHGFLHLLGYDHDTPEAERDMFARQEAILAQAGLHR
jgi:probable rRNA maturation factor